MHACVRKLRHRGPKVSKSFSYVCLIFILLCHVRVMLLLYTTGVPHLFRLYNHASPCRLKQRNRAIEPQSHRATDIKPAEKIRHEENNYSFLHFVYLQPYRSNMNYVRCSGIFAYLRISSCLPTGITEHGIHLYRHHLQISS